MTFSDTTMMELGITQSTNIHNTRSLIHTLKYVLDNFADRRSLHGGRI